MIPIHIIWGNQSRGCIQNGTFSNNDKLKEMRTQKINLSQTSPIWIKMYPILKLKNESICHRPVMEKPVLWEYSAVGLGKQKIHIGKECGRADSPYGACGNILGGKFKPHAGLHPDDHLTISGFLFLLTVFVFNSTYRISGWILRKPYKMQFFQN